MLFAAKETVAAMYSTSPAIIALASSLLSWVALYHLADSAQAVCAFLLRCYRITLAPLILYGLLLWGLGLYGGYWLTYKGFAGQLPSTTPVSFWLAGSLALMCVALSFLALLWRAVRKSQQHD
jgi:MATE family multidrug resistance protein